ncbi:bola-like protein [Lactarius deliciosus]|nr:bola-like protein [Lactarius deliciosus]
MPVTPDELKAAICAAIQVTHVEVEDNSSGCGENFSVLIISKVDFEGKTTLARHKMVNEALKTQIAQIHAFTQVYLSSSHIRGTSLMLAVEKTLTPQQWEDSKGGVNAA